LHAAHPSGHPDPTYSFDAQTKEGSAEAALEKLQAFYSACKAIEQRLSQRKARLKAKIPDIESTYNALLQMQSQVRTGRGSRLGSVGNPNPRHVLHVLPCARRRSMGWR